MDVGERCFLLDDSFAKFAIRGDNVQNTYGKVRVWPPWGQAHSVFPSGSPLPIDGEG